MGSPPSKSRRSSTSGFGCELATQLLDRGDTVVGTVRRADSVADLVQKYPDTFHRELLDVTDAAAVREIGDRSFESLGRIDVVVSNAGYGLFGAAEELSDEQVSHIIATNLTGSIQLIRASLPRRPTWPPRRTSRQASDKDQRNRT